MSHLNEHENPHTPTSAPASASARSERTAPSAVSRAAHVPAGQDLGHRWSTRLADHHDPADRRAVRQIFELTFESSAEADLVEELAAGGEGWLPQYSLVAMTASIPGTDMHSDPMGYGTLVRGHIDDAPVLALAPHGVLPEHQGQGAGTAIVEALLQRARADGEPAVVVYGWPEYYAKFGFRPAAEHDVTAGFADQPEALQVMALQEGATVPSGEFRYPPAFGSQNAQA